MKGTPSLNKVADNGTGREADDADSKNPFALAEVLETEIADRGNLSIITQMRPAMEEAVTRCLEQAEPSSYYITALFALLLGRPYESIGHLAKAISCSDARSMLESAWRTLGRLRAAAPDTMGLTWNRLLLSAGVAAKDHTSAWNSEPTDAASCGSLSPSSPNPFAGREDPIVIVIGDCGTDWDASKDKYEQMLLEALQSFKGTLVSGGSQNGISGLVGSLSECAEHPLLTIGYLPHQTGKARVDTRYTLNIRTEGTAFSPLEPLRCWHDLLEAGIDPRTVRAIGVGGGEISAAEYRIALAMGAKVAVLPDSGGAVGELLADAHWKKSRDLIQLPEEMEALCGFLSALDQKPAGSATR